MKIYIHILLLVTTFFCIALYFNPYTPSEPKPTQVKELASISHPIRSINPADTNYKDLAFLKDKLKGVNLVMLGEQTHGDGSSFLAKSRLIRFLHQEMNFDVLLFESNIYECFNLWKNLSETPVRLPSDFSSALFFFWGSSNQTKDLRTYIMQRAQSTHPLILGGFDVQFSGELSENTRLYLMKSYLTKKNIELEEEYNNFSHVMKNYYHVIKSKTSKAMSNVIKDAVFDELNSLIIRLSSTQQTNEDKIFLRYLLGIKTELQYQWTHPDDMVKQQIIRDSMMAENITWLKEHFYKNKKIMIWAANSHIFYNTHLMGSPVGLKYKRMSDYLKDQYDSLCYSINFTSYAGKAYDFDGKASVINKSAGYGIEAALHATEDSLLFIDVGSQPKNSFLRGKTTMKLFGHYNIPAYWSKMTDGIFFIDQMKPVTFDYNETILLK